MYNIIYINTYIHTYIFRYRNKIHVDPNILYECITLKPTNNHSPLANPLSSIHSILIIITIVLIFDTFYYFNLIVKEL